MIIQYLQFLSCVSSCLGFISFIQQVLIEQFAYFLILF